MRIPCEDYILILRLKDPVIKIKENQHKIFLNY